MAKVIRIERVHPRNGVEEHPIKTERGYVLGDPRHSNTKHHLANEVHAKTLEDAASLVEAGHSLRMGRPGKRPSLISPSSLRIVRA